MTASSSHGPRDGRWPQNGLGLLAGHVLHANQLRDLSGSRPGRRPHLLTMLHFQGGVPCDEQVFPRR